MGSLQALQDPIEAEHTAAETRPHEFDELWQRRLALEREIVDVPATKIHDAVFKVTLLTSFLADGELRLGRTHSAFRSANGRSSSEMRLTMSGGARAGGPRRDFCWN